MTGIGIGGRIKFADNKAFERQLDKDMGMLFGDGIYLGYEEPDRVVELVAEDAVDEASAADTNLATIDLRKEKPVPVKNLSKGSFMLTCFNSRDPAYTSDMFDVYTEYCTGFEFRDGNVHLHFRIDSVSVKSVNSLKRMVRSIDIDYFDYVSREEYIGNHIVKLSYHVEFKNIEMTGFKGDYSVQTLTLVYKLLECIS